MSPIRFLVIGYIVIIAAGASLLTFPVSSQTGERQPVLDAVFMASSGIATCGLTVVDIGSYYSTFGQLVILSIFQIGGMGYMAFFVLIAYALRRKLSASRRIAARESLSEAVGGNLRRFFLSVVIFTFVFELIGACALSMIWAREFPTGRAVYLGVYHSISAFCTAGMSVLPDSLVPWRNSLALNLVIDAVSLAGAIGFLVFYDLCHFLKKFLRREYPRRVSCHSKLSMLVTFIVIAAGAAVILVAERGGPPRALRDRALSASFQSISASTTDGFNTADIGAMSPTSLFMIILLMFVGASPGSTGGGIKTTTLGVIVLYCVAHLRGRKDANVFRKRIPDETINKALVVFMGFLAVAIADVLVLSATEKGTFLQIAFEAVSALGNAGLSAGLTPHLTAVGKVVLTVTMFIGRIGPLSAGLFLVGDPYPLPVRYVEGKIFIG